MSSREAISRSRSGAGISPASSGAVGIARRREIQFAADAAWPHTNKTNAGIRTEFKLPSDKAMK